MVASFSVGLRVSRGKRWQGGWSVLWLGRSAVASRPAIKGQRLNVQPYKVEAMDQQNHPPYWTRLVLHTDRAVGRIPNAVVATARRTKCCWYPNNRSRDLPLGLTRPHGDDGASGEVNMLHVLAALIRHPNRQRLYCT